MKFYMNFMKPYLEDGVGHIEEQGKTKCQTVEAHLPGVGVHLEEHLGNKYSFKVPRILKLAFVKSAERKKRKRFKVKGMTMRGLF